MLRDMIHQLRIYEIFDQNKEMFHKRFQEHAIPIMKNYGFNIIATWEARFEQGPRFIYLLAWPDEETMKNAWEKFRMDEKWKEIKKVTNAKYGDLVGTIQEHVLIPTGYSPRIMMMRPTVASNSNLS